MKKKTKHNKVWLAIVGVVIVAALFLLYKVFGPAANKPDGGFLYVKTGTDMQGLKTQLHEEHILSGNFWFDKVASLLNFETVKPGKYKVDGSTSIFSLVRMLKNGQQIPVNFVITKLRTREQLAAKIGRSFEADSLAAIVFLNNNDSLAKYNVDTNTVMGLALPLTYEVKWNTEVRPIIEKFYNAYNEFWTAERKQKAMAQGLTIGEVITMASIIDEETNNKAEMPQIASVYMNRVKKGMPLQADPTIKFALKDFSLKRIMFKHLTVESPFNTYRNKGLPPGPVCTPQATTIDAVLNAPKTELLYFVASSKFDGTHIFSTNYADHMRLAKEYQQALDVRTAAKSTTQP